MDENSLVHPLYTPELLRFASVGVDFCGVIEQAKTLPLSALINYLCPLLPKLYALAWDLSDEQEYDPEVDLLPSYVTETTYATLQSQLEELFGAYDSFIDTQNQHNEHSDVPIAVHLSELLCDVYQPVGDLLGVLKERNEFALPGAVARCRNDFSAYWGDNCLAAMRALHSLRFSSVYDSIVEDEEQPDPEQQFLSNLF